MLLQFRPLALRLPKCDSVFLAFQEGVNNAREEEKKQKDREKLYKIMKFNYA